MLAREVVAHRTPLASYLPLAALIAGTLFLAPHAPRAVSHRHHHVHRCVVVEGTWRGDIVVPRWSYQRMPTFVVEGRFTMPIFVPPLHLRVGIYDGDQLTDVDQVIGALKQLLVTPHS